VGHREDPACPDPASVTAALALGWQDVARFKEAARNRVAVLVAVLRLPTLCTDLVVSLSAPTVVAEGSSSFVSTGGGVRGDAASVATGALAALRAALRTLCVRDWGLFSPGNAGGDAGSEHEGSEQ
jgi:hypothetical protein